MPNRLNNEFILKDTGASNAINTLNLPRHRWYYYKEGFSPVLVEKAIEATEVKPNEIILDPFNGSGTTTLTASTHGYKSIGIEVNPFTAFLSVAKTKNIEVSKLKNSASMLIGAAEKSTKSPLIGFSTFSEKEGLDKWLFNNDVLTAFEGAWNKTKEISSYNARKILQLALISSAMENCNAARDGKCLRYRSSWRDKKYDRTSFLDSFGKKLIEITEDLPSSYIDTKATILNRDTRRILKSRKQDFKFKLCVTSPPYLNTFDYTDIYRPELFLGKFVKNMEELYQLRLRTVRSHLQVKWASPKSNDFGILYNQSLNHLIENEAQLMDKKIPLMMQAYFEDMFNILKHLKSRAEDKAQLWFIVSNSGYADLELPVDLIIADIGTKAGWFLKEIGVLRYLKRRKSKHSPNVNLLRESVIIFSVTEG